MNTSIIIYGPQGCGKTRHSKALAQHFGLSQISDDFPSFSKPNPEDTLHLCQEKPDIPGRTLVLTFDEAMREAGLTVPALDLGVRARDKITGFEGVVTGIARYLTGCSQAVLTPKIGVDGSIRAAEWFDEGRLEVQGAGITADAVAGRTNGGPQRDAPRRS